MKMLTRTPEPCSAQEAARRLRACGVGTWSAVGGGLARDTNGGRYAVVVLDPTQHCWAGRYAGQGVIAVGRLS